MTQIEISQDTFDSLLALAREQGIAESAINELADIKLRQAVGAAMQSRLSGEQLVESFREFRGTMRDTTIEDIVADRHRGLR